MCGACFQFSTVLTLKADGSGTIDERLLFTQAAVTQLRQLASLGGDGQAFDPLSEKQAREAATTMGRGVTYVSSAVVDTSEGVGRAIHGRDLGPADLTEKGERFLSTETSSSVFVRLIDPAGDLVGIATPATTSGLLHPAVVLV